MKPVSIIVVAYTPDKNLKKILKILNEQNYKGKIEILIISRKKGLANNINYGIRKAKYDIIVTLHGDCLPSGRNWLSNLIKPFDDKRVIASVSKVHLPLSIWNSFDIFTKSLTIKERGTITPYLDEKGCAYRKSILEKVGFFNSKSFKTAGEDFDMYIKLKEEGIIAYPNAKVIHMHPTTFKKRIRKTYQNANGFGALLRIHGKNMPRWWLGLLKAIPLVGFFIFIITFPFNKKLSFYPFYLLTTPILHIFY